MSIVARQSTALELAIGPVLDADGVAVTGCVVGDFKIKKTTGNFAALNASATLTHVSAGMYDLVLTTSDTDTVGLCCIAIDDTTNACAPVYLQVMEEVIYDALYAASANAYAGSAGSTTLGSGAITATVIATGAIDADAIADNAIDAGAIASDAITAAKIANGAIDAATFAADVDAEARGWLGLASANLDTQLGDLPTVAEFEARTLVAADYTIVSDLGTVQTGDVFARITGTGAVTFASLTVSGNTTFTGTTTHTGHVLYSDGIAIAAPSTANRDGFKITGNGTGQGMLVTGGSTAGCGIKAVGGTDGIGFYIMATGDEVGLRVDAGTANDAVFFNGTGAGDGLHSSGGSSGGMGIHALAGTDGHGIKAQGAGTGSGMYVAGGATGNGASFIGGSSSGNGIDCSATSGDGIESDGGGAGTGFDADMTGNITGNLSGSVGSVTGNVGGNVTGSVGSVTNLTVQASTTLASGTHNPQGGDAYARLGAPAGASASADIAAAKAVIDTIEARGDRVVARCTVGSASTTTSIVTSACSPAGAAADQFKGRIVVFDKATTTAALRGQATDITASSNSSTPTLTVTALTTAPASGDTFSIV